MNGMEDSFVTTRPFRFTLIVLVIILIILIPVYFYTKSAAESRAEAGKEKLVTESFSEVNYWFSTESTLSESDKRTLFKINYQNNFVQWTGMMLSCEEVDGAYRVSVTHQNSDFPDVLFTTFNDCTMIQPGATITYKMKLIDWKIRSYIGSEGQIIV